MNTDSSASTSQKTSAHTDSLDQITAHETAEAKRLQAELDAMHTEIEQAKADGLKRKEEAMNQYKNAAAKELEELKNSELRNLITKANEQKKEKVADIQGKAKANQAKALDLLINRFKEL